jgi:hypothetical protein
MSLDELPAETPDPANRHERIARRAFALWEHQGRPDGHDVANWLQAESEIRDEDDFRKLLRSLEREHEEVREDERVSADTTSEAVTPDAGPEVAPGNGRLPARHAVNDE